MRGAGDFRGVIKFGIGLLCATAFVLILIILSGNEIDKTGEQALLTAVALAFLSLTAGAGSHLSLRQPQLALLGYATVAISALAFLATAAALWGGSDGDDWKPVIVCLILAFAGGHSSVLLAGVDKRDSDGARLVRGGTLVTLWLLVVISVIEIGKEGDDFSVPVYGVIAVLYALGTIVLPLLRRLTPPPESTEGLRIDRLVVRTSAPERSQRFYAEGLGASVEAGPEGRICFVWPGSAESAVIHLQARGIEIVEGPTVRNGARGVGSSVCCRDPDGNLVELISYG